MEGEVRRRGELNAFMLGAKCMQADVEGGTGRDIESADLCKMSQQLSLAQRSHRRRFLLDCEDEDRLKRT